MPVAEKLHGSGDVDRFIEVPHAADSSFAGGQKRQVPELGGLRRQFRDGQRVIP